MAASVGPISPGEIFQFEITDDGDAVTFSFTQVGNEARSVTAEGSVESDSLGRGHIVFHNREGGFVARLDNVSITRLEDPDHFRVTRIDCDRVADTFRITWNSQPGKIYTLFQSTSLSSFTGDIADDIVSQGESTTYPPVGEPPFANPNPTSKKLFFSVDENRALSVDENRAP